MLSLDITRRHFFAGCGVGLGKFALAGLLNNAFAAAPPARMQGAPQPQRSAPRRADRPSRIYNPRRRRHKIQRRERHARRAPVPAALAGRVLPSARTAGWELCVPDTTGEKLYVQ